MNYLKMVMRSTISKIEYQSAQFCAFYVAGFLRPLKSSLRPKRIPLTMIDYVYKI